MGIILEVNNGPFSGKQIPCRKGESVFIGREPSKSKFALPHDKHMSGGHFTVECGEHGARIIDRGSVNGTFLNGKRITEAAIVDGNEIRAGQTIFVVRIVPDVQSDAASRLPKPVPEPEPAGAIKPVSTSAPVRPKTDPIQPPRTAAPHRHDQHPALILGEWTFAKIPESWEINEGFGIRLPTKDAFPSNIGVTQEPLGVGISLQQYVEAQIKMLRQYLREPQIEAAVPPPIPGAEETMALEVRYKTKEGQSIYYHRLYARSGKTVGVLMLTALEKDVAEIRGAHQVVVAGSSFHLLIQ